MASHYRSGNNLNIMDNAGFDRDADRGHVELAAVMLPQQQQQLIVVAPATAINSNGHAAAGGCSDTCISLHQQHGAAAKPPESPWHHLKTIFLVGTIVFLAIWVLVYTLLSQFNALGG